MDIDGRTETFPPLLESANLSGSVGAAVTGASWLVAAPLDRFVPWLLESTLAAAAAGTVIEVATSTRHVALLRTRRTRPRRAMRERRRRAKSTPTGTPFGRPALYWRASAVSTSTARRDGTSRSFHLREISQTAPGPGPRVGSLPELDCLEV